jgi:hypothetical protein
MFARVRTLVHATNPMRRDDFEALILKQVEREAHRPPVKAQLKVATFTEKWGHCR